MVGGRIKLGPDSYIIYNCASCMRGPINPKYWLRGVKPGMEHQSGGTVTMRKWYCPDDECLASWHWGSGGSKRMLIFNDPDEGLQLVIIGDVTPEEEHMITCIKSAVLLEAIVLITGEKVEIGLPAIINGIRWLNDQCEQTLLASHLPKVWRKAVRRRPSRIRKSSRTASTRR